MSQPDGPKELNLEYEALMVAEDVQPLIKALSAYYHGSPGYDLSAFNKHGGQEHARYVAGHYGIQNMSRFVVYLRERLWNIKS